MVGYQVIGHYKSLHPDCCTSATISDGKVFLDLECAKSFAKSEMHAGYSIVEHDDITHYWDKDRNQYFVIKTQEWIPAPHNER